MGDDSPARVDKIDSDHTYYFYASDYFGMELVFPHFDGSGYRGWRNSILIALSAKNKLEFIDGSLPRTKEGVPDMRH